MKWVIFSASDSFNRFMKKIIVDGVVFKTSLSVLTTKSECYLIHSPSMGVAYKQWLATQTQYADIKCVVCADKPTVVGMLDVVNLGAKAYCNSYMQNIHYQQMLRLVESGQSWFPPQLLAETFQLANKSLNSKNTDNQLSELTSKEKEVSLAVGKGNTNQQIATSLNISESTVKTHLTHIFKKLNIKDRVALVLHMKS